MACKIKTRYFPKTQTAVEREITDSTKKLVEEVLQVALFGKCKKKIIPPDLNIYIQSRHLVKTNILFTALVFLTEYMHKCQLIYTVPEGLFCKGHEWEETHPLPGMARGNSA